MSNTEKIINIFINRKDFERHSDFSDYIEDIGDICHNELVILTNKKIYVFYADSNEQGGDIYLEEENGDDLKDLIGQDLLEIKRKKTFNFDFVFWDIKTSQETRTIRFLLIPYNNGGYVYTFDSVYLSSENIPEDIDINKLNRKE